MSTWISVAIACPRCHVETAARVAQGVHVTRVPRVRTEVLTRTYNEIACSGCATRLAIHESFIYVDFDRGHWILVATREDRDAWRDWERKLDEGFARAFEHGSPMAHELSARMHARVVFGYEALREKLVVWSAGIEDQIIECMKVRAIAEDPTLATPGSTMVVDAITADGIRVGWFADRRDHDPSRVVVLPAAWVGESDRDHAILRARFAELWRHRFVSFERLASATVEST